MAERKTRIRASQLISMLPDDVDAINSPLEGLGIYYDSATQKFRWGGSGYAQTVTVAKSGGDYTTIQGAIDSITDATTSKRYVVIVYPGDYAENITLKNYVDLIGVCRHTTRITPTSGTALTFPSTFCNVQNMGINVNYGTITAATTAIYIPSGFGIYSITQCAIDIQKDGGNFAFFGLDAQGGVTIVSDTIFNYNITAGTDSTLIQSAVRIGSVLSFVFTNCKIDIENSDTNDILAGIQATGGSQNTAIITNCNISVVNNGNGITAGFYFYSSNLGASIVQSDIDITAVGTVYGVYMTTSSGGTLNSEYMDFVLLSTGSTDYLGFVNTSDTWNSFCDKLRFTNSILGAGTFTTINSASNGDFNISGNLTVGSLTTPYQETVTVAKSGADFTTIAAAIASITTASSSNPFVIRVMPGVYTESPLTMKSYVDIIGLGRDSVKIVTDDNNNPFITMNSNSRIANVAIQGPTNDSAVYIATGDNNCFVENVFLESGQTFIECTGTSSQVIVEECKVSNVITTGLYTSSSGRIDASNFLSYATNHIYADGGTIWIHNSGGVGGTNGLYANNFGIIYPISLSFENVTNVVRLGSTGINEILGAAIISRGTVSYDVLQENSSSKLRLTGCFMHVDKFSVTDWSNIDIDFNSDKEGDEGFNVVKELHVGVPEDGSESCLGEGDSYTRGMLVYTYNGSTYSDVSSSAASASGSTFTFPNTSVNTAIYVASTLQNSDYLKHLGLKLSITTAAVLGSGVIVSEYWNGTSWTAFNNMSVKNSAPNLPYGKNIFLRVDSEQLRYDISIQDDWTKNDPMTLGTTYYWVRFRIDTASITTAPIFEQFKLHSNRMEINADGWPEYFGNARPISRLPWDWSLARPFAQSPANQDLYVSDNVGVGRVDNNFQDLTTDQQGFCSFLPYDLDTSCKVKFTWSAITDNVSAGNIRWNIRWAYTTDDDNVYRGTGTAPGTGPNEQQLTVDLAAPTAIDTQKTYEIELNIADMISRRTGGFGDILWISIERVGADANDTHTGDVSVINFAAFYYKWCEGGHK